MDKVNEKSREGMKVTKRNLTDKRNAIIQIVNLLKDQIQYNGYSLSDELS